MERDLGRLFDLHTHRTENDPTGIVNVDLLKSTLSGVLPTKGMERRERCFYSAGIHPSTLTEHNAEEQLSSLKRLLEAEALIAIGETGLDKLVNASLALQVEVFKKQVELSERYRHPLIIHCVRALEELLAVRKALAPEQPWIWHGFRGKPEQANQLLKLGFYLSFGEHYSDAAMRAVPDDRLFLETDASLLDIEVILQQSAKVRRVEVDHLRETIHENIEKVFFKG